MSRGRRMALLRKIFDGLWRVVFYVVVVGVPMLVLGGIGLTLMGRGMFGRAETEFVERSAVESAGGFAKLPSVNPIR